MDENKKVEWGRGLRGIFELQAFFFICLIFPKEKCFRENPGTSLEEKKVETRILPRDYSWRESSSLSIHSNWRAQFYNSKNLAFLQI